MITEDWPLGESEKMFKAGERLVMVCELYKLLWKLGHICNLLTSMA